MSPFEHLERLSSDGQQGQISSVVSKMEHWLRGNAIITDDNESGVIEIRAGQINDATLEIRQVIYQGYADYALIRTTRRTKTPKNLLSAIYTPLIIDHDNRPAMNNTLMSCGESIWIEKPTLMGPDITFLIVRLSAQLLLSATRHDETLAELDRTRYALAFYREMAETKPLNYVCPAPECGKKGFSTTPGLYDHFDKKFREKGDPIHGGLSQHRKPTGNRIDINEAMAACLGRPITMPPQGGACFTAPYLIAQTYSAPPRAQGFRTLPDASSLKDDQINYLLDSQKDYYVQVHNALA